MDNYQNWKGFGCTTDCARKLLIQAGAQGGW